jgi:hypothetical protein
MGEFELIERILLGFGDKAPLLLVFWMFVRYMWPDIKDLVIKYLETRQPDVVAMRLDNLATEISLLVGSLNTYLGVTSTNLPASVRATVMNTAAVSPPVRPDKRSEGGESVEDKRAAASKAEGTS